MPAETPAVPVIWSAELSPAHRAELYDLLAAAHATDGRPEVEPASTLPGPFGTGEYGLLHVDGALVGVLRRDVDGDAFGRQVVELVVRPPARGRGHGAALLTALREHAPAREGRAETVRIWAHGDHPAAAKLAARFGLRRVRELQRLRCTLPAELAEGLPAKPLPAGVRLRAFVPGQDEAAMVEVNRQAFAWHPEQGRLSIAEVRAAEAESWFDPAGFLLAVDEHDRLLGFHWTKIHRAPDAEPIGEVYVIGIDPSAQGGGLGSALTVAGLRHLGGRGVRQVMLYAESDNTAALGLYHRLGFTLWDVDVQYAY